MKRIFCFAALLLLTALLMSCGQKAEAIEEDGGRNDASDPNAPKEISSTMLISFQCEFSAIDLTEEDSYLSGRNYQLNAVLKDGAVKGSYRSNDRNGQQEEKSFAASHKFLEDVQKIVSAYDFAQYNGINISVSGLPDDYGAYLQIVYASGERLYASDNQDCFLPLSAMEELEALFYGQAAGKPEVLNLTVGEEASFENIGGCFVEARSDFLELGYPDWDGEWMGAEKYPILAKALAEYNADVRSRYEGELYHLREIAPHVNDEAVYFYSDTFVTRNDTQVVSLYQHISLYDGWMGNEWESRNINSRTGAELSFSDVFTDPEKLPSLLTQELQRKYPACREIPDLEETIKESIEMEDGEVCFALSYGFVHFFFAEYLLENHFMGQHLALSFADHPWLVKAQYRAVPESHLLELEYNVACLTADGKRLNMSWMINGEWDESILWNMIVNGKTYTEEFYGYMPQRCFLIHIKGRDFLYLQEPAGDISLTTNIYEITASSLEKIGQIPLAMHSEVNLNPERMLMDINDTLFTDGVILMPCGLYRTGGDGMPVLLENIFGVTGTDMIGKETFRIYMTDPKDASVEEGFTTVAQGIVLTPFRTDMETYLDLFTEDGRAIRLTIDGWYDEMEIHGFGTLSDGFELSMYHPNE